MNDTVMKLGQESPKIKFMKNLKCSDRTPNFGKRIFPRAVLPLMGIVLLTLLSNSTQAAIIAQYPFTTDLASTDTEANSSAGNIAATGLSGSSGINAGSFRIVNADLGTSQDLGKYLEFTVTAQNGMSLTSLTFDFASDGNPKVGNTFVRSSLDSFGANLTVTPGSVTGVGSAGQTVDLTGGTFDNQGSFTFRFYASKGTSGNYNLSYDNIVLNGTVVPVPEPINVALGVFGLCVASAGVGRRFYLRARA